MKRTVTIATVIISAALLASCYVMSTQPTGTINVGFASASSRSINPASTTAHVYLYTYASGGASYSLYTFPDGKQYQSFTYPGSVSITGIPVGLWKVLVSVGKPVNGVLETTDYGASSVISVVGGTNTGVSITTQPSSFAYSGDLAGQSLNGLAYDPLGGGDLYASSGSMVWSGTPGTTAPIMPTMSSVAGSSQIASDGLQIQSLANGYSGYGTGTTAPHALFVNSNKGIVTYNGTTFDTSFSQNLKDTSGNPLTILQSGAISEPDPTTGTDVAVFFQRDHGLGGIFLNSGSPTPATATWVDIDLSGKVTGQPIYNFTLNSDATGSTYAFFASKIGAFWTTTSLVSSSNSTDDLQSFAHFFTATVNGEAVPIQAVAVAIPSQSSSGTLYVGTPVGAYSTSVSESNGSVTLGTSWSLVGSTSGDSIVAISVDQTSQDVAFRSQYNLYTLVPSTTSATALPFYSGVPGQITKMEWLKGTLFVAGTEGLVSFTP